MGYPAGEHDQPRFSGAARVEGVLERVVFQNDEKGFAIVEVVSRDGSKHMVKGSLLGARLGETIRVVGDREEHPRFGTQIRAKSVEVVLPATDAGVRAYLGSGLIKGVGPELATRIVDELGAGVIEIIEKDPRQLRRVPGIGKKKLESIVSSIAKQKGLREFVSFLAGSGVSARAAQRIWGHYGSDALRLVRENPYRLASEVWGFGFRKADEIAGKLGLPKDSIERARAGLSYCLSEAAGAGHTCVPREHLILKTEQLLQAEGAPVRAALEGLEKEKGVFSEPSATAAVEENVDNLFEYLPHLLAAERIVAKQILRLLAAKAPPPLASLAAVDATARNIKFQLHAQQREAVASALQERILVITGGPGVGKTTITRLIVEIANARGHVVLLASPTGRAARRLSEATGREASTLHRLLEFNPKTGRFAKNENNPLMARMVIVDESSMLDIALAAHLLRAVEPPTRIVFVGDANQLPSVGPGNFLQDLIDSGCPRVIKLTKVFRQGAASGIVEGAHRILEGEAPEFTNQPTDGGGDLFFIEREDPLEVLKTVLHVATERIPQRFGLDPRAEIQIIAPMYRGDAGVDRLNREMRQKLNATGPAIGSGDRMYRLGDRVMVTRNDINRDIFNGDVGRITDIQFSQGSVSVNFGDRTVQFTEAQFGDIVPAYAISVHRSQGSEYPAVVIPMVTQHFVMLRRPLLYTAVTRAKRVCVIVGSRRALGIAVQEARLEERFSLLKERLSPPRETAAAT
ncbi:MAG: ATP-dependent RecD-like DNA helicase [Planctomycetes bacterium]|nr:ATP-dependent RecD-like DNA helicase [Planctomycetota bacterium]